METKASNSRTPRGNREGKTDASSAGGIGRFRHASGCLLASYLLSEEEFAAPAAEATDA
jgi:hypothetical protein